MAESVKRYGGLWERVLSWENLLLAARKARRAKRSRAAVQRFEFNLEAELLRLRHELRTGTYVPGPFRTHWIARPKPRLISAAPYRDRVVHHAVMNVLEPILDRHFHPHSYACRNGKGTHRAADRLQALMRRYRYALQCDVRKFFPSIDHQLLKRMFRRLVKDPDLLGLMDLIVDRSNPQERVLEWFPGDDLFAPLERARGLPIGNLTSQWFANWYLDGLDHFVTSRLGIGGYVRYCDDFVLLHNDRAKLARAREQVAGRLRLDRLRMRDEGAPVVSVRHGLRFVGYRTWPSHRIVRKRSVRAFRRRVRWMQARYAEGAVHRDEVERRIFGWVGHARQADSALLLRRLSREWRFSRA
jgi:RNA-directed DNA polymerase